jgi:hypothetical protein
MIFIGLTVPAEMLLSQIHTLRGAAIMETWYTVEQPRDRACWEVNPRLWEHFSNRVLQDTGRNPMRSPLLTEAYVVQTLDSWSQDAKISQQ